MEVKKEVGDDGDWHVEQKICYSGQRWAGMVMILAQLVVVVGFVALFFAMTGSNRIW